MNPFDLWLTIFGMGLIVFTVRYVPMALLERFRIPAWVRQALRFVPAAALSGLVFPALFTENGQWAGFVHPQLWAGALALLAAWRFKNTLLTMAVGLLALLLIRMLKLQ
jgi:branched-subunit amino acid transport protein